MKYFRSVVCFSALTLVCSLSAQSADDPVPAKKRVPATREAKSSPASQQQRTSGFPESVRDRPAQIVYQVLLAEFALQRGNVELASQAYIDLARRTSDPKVLERTVAVTGFAKRFDLAYEAARLWTEIEPASKPAQQALVSVMIASNRFDELAPHLIRLLEQDKEMLGEALLGLNRLLARNPDRQTVFRVVEKVCQPFAGIAEAHYALAMAAGSAGVNDRALAAAQRALELRPDWEMAALLQAQILLRLSTVGAIQFLQEFVDKNPEAHDARMQLARMLVGEKRYADARVQFEKLLKANPDRPEVVYPVAILALQQNDPALAEAQFKHFLTLPVQNKSYAYYYLGQIAEDNKRVDEAIAYYAQVGPGEQYLPSQMRRARLLKEQGKLDEARKVLSSTNAASPEDSTQLAIAEAGLLRDARQTQAAFDVLEPLLAKQPEQPDLLYETALLAEKLGRMDVMETRLRKLIELRPESPQAYNALGYSFADRNIRLPEARELIEKALKQAPDDFFILDSMGWVLYRQGDLSGALSYLERAFSKHDDPEIAAHLGEVLWALGRQDDARRIWREAQKKHPNSEALADVIKKFVP